MTAPQDSTGGRGHSPARRRAPVAALHPGRCYAWAAGRLGTAMLAIVLAAVLANGGLAARADTPPAGLTPVVQLDIDHTPGSTEVRQP